ncbi:Methionine synthase [Trichinella spiralis]
MIARLGQPEISGRIGKRNYFPRVFCACTNLEHCFTGPNTTAQGTYNREQNDIVIDEINQTLENVGVYTEERLVTSSGPGETERSTETSTFVDDGSAMLELREKRLYSSELPPAFERTSAEIV